MKRTIPGILLAVAWILLLVLGNSLLFYLVMIGVAVIGGHEYLSMIFEKRPRVLSRLYLLAAITLPVVAVWPGGNTHCSQGGLFVAFLLLILYFLARYTHLERGYEQFCQMVFGVIYVGFLASYLVMLRYLPEGGSWLVLLTAITGGSDSGAYYFGTKFGRTKLCPSISPKKTVEGAVGGLISGVIAAIVAAGLVFQEVNWLFVIPVAVLLTGVGILGDLTESIIKRSTDTKDSGTLLAGHGGILDRIDSLLLASPVLYYLLIVMGVQ